MSKQFTLNTRKAVEKARDTARDSMSLQSSHVELVPAEVVSVEGETYTVKLTQNEDESATLSKIRSFSGVEYEEGDAVHLKYAKPGAHPYIFDGKGFGGGCCNAALLRD